MFPCLIREQSCLRPGAELRLLLLGEAEGGDEGGEEGEGSSADVAVGVLAAAPGYTGHQGGEGGGAERPRVGAG